MTGGHIAVSTYKAEMGCSPLVGARQLLDSTCPVCVLSHLISRVTLFLSGNMICPRGLCSEQVAAPRSGPRLHLQGTASDHSTLEAMTLICHCRVCAGLD